MYKATASSAAFFPRVADHSTKGSRRGYDLLGHGENVLDVMSDEDRRVSLVVRVKAVMDELTRLPKKHPRRVALGQEQAELQAAIRAIRPASKAPGAPYHFVDVCRERLPKGQFEALMSEAVRRCGVPSRNAAALGLRVQTEPTP